ncbi:MAG: 30S ribosomal protein S8 [Candidatus Daviesbacteria bacterium]|nr:30S ribosomal protein S8 [Candidatus Daviesbacteria bacterium]
MNDKVGDLLIRIKNGYMARRGEVNVSYSKLAVAICELLKKEEYIESLEVLDREIKLVLKYDFDEKTANKIPAVSDVKRISKPGRKVYAGSHKLPHVFDGLGIALISTPKGIMTDREARKEGVGGEVMAYVW